MASLDHPVLKEYGYATRLTCGPAHAVDTNICCAKGIVCSVLNTDHFLSSAGTAFVAVRSTLRDNEVGAWEMCTA